MAGFFLLGFRGALIKVSADTGSRGLMPVQKRYKMRYKLVAVAPWKQSVSWVGVMGPPSAGVESLREVMG